MPITLRVDDDSKDIKLEVASTNISLKVDEYALTVQSDHDYYDGEYSVTPEFFAQTLETANKIMENDVTVEAIVVSRTTNPSGGKTVYIGGNING